ncbi:MAG: hypothetical protein LBR08_04615 [Bacteroidales bacterium]|jgi:hypothetical protein|nr:hypothetical protein [Bacteroidales bacterium]
MKTAIIFILLCAAFPLLAQTERQILPADMKQMTVVTEPATLPQGFFRAGESVAYNRFSYIWFDENRKKKDFYTVENNWFLNITSRTRLEYGLTDRLQVHASIAYLFKQYQTGALEHGAQTDTVYDMSAIHRGHGMNSIHTGMSFQFIPQRDGRQSSLTGTVDLLIPVGHKNLNHIKGFHDYRLPTSDGYFATQIDLAYKKISYPFSWTAEAAYTHNFPCTLADNSFQELVNKVGDVLELRSGLNFHLNEWIALTNKLTFRSAARTTSTYATGEVKEYMKNDILYYTGYLVFHVGRCRISEGVQATVTAKNRRADNLFYLTVEYLF